MGMLRQELVSFLILALVAASIQEEIDSSNSNLQQVGRNKKSSGLYISIRNIFMYLLFAVFSLFNVVTFRNDGCTSTDSNRNGTCFTSTECQDKGGRALGNCAAGFGITYLYLQITKNLVQSKWFFNLT